MMSNVVEKMGTAFHESFALSRPAVGQILGAVASARTAESGRLTYGHFRQTTTLGANYIKAMRRYCRACGLVDAAEHPTPFGAMVSMNDPDLSCPATQWLIHYFLSANYHAGPGFWCWLVEKALNGAASITTQDVAAQIEAYLLETGDRALARNTLTSTAGVFVGTYTKSDALGSLGVLAECPEASNGTRVFSVGANLSIPSVPVVAYVIADYWDNEWTGRTSVNLGWMSDPGGPGSLLLMNSGEIGDALREMQNAGLVELQRRQAPYQVFRTWADTNELLERIYD